MRFSSSSGRPMSRHPIQRMVTVNTPPRATLFITGLGMGGAETQFVRLAVGLRKRGWAIDILTLLPPEHFTDQLVAADIPVRSFGAKRGRIQFGVAGSLLRDLRRESPDVLVTFLFHPNMLGRVLARLSGVPVINSIRGERFGGAVRERAMRWTASLPQHLVINSAHAHDRLVRDRIVKPTSVSVIKNGLDTAVYQNRARRSQTRARLGVGESDFLWTTIGRLEYPKDHPSLLQSLSTLMASRPEMRLAIVGEGPARPDLEKMAADLGVVTRVQFLGIRKDVPDLLAASDGFVFASENEGLPNVIMEALAAGLPVVATAVGGVPELIRHGESGWLVPPSNPGALAALMQHVVALPAEELKRIGHNGADFIEATFGIDTYVDQWEQLLLRYRKIT